VLINMYSMGSGQSIEGSGKSSGASRKTSERQRSVVVSGAFEEREERERSAERKINFTVVQLYGSTPQYSVLFHSVLPMQSSRAALAFRLSLLISPLILLLILPMILTLYSLLLEQSRYKTSFHRSSQLSVWHDAYVHV
jgi:hypothetical protein